ncbi:hypothetical protein [Roseovarius pacificus]|uniref:hypothetical protein n=1 Tax=Roseovarius pacificus TaxID=337701 RepID=UPI00403A1613
MTLAQDFIGVAVAKNWIEVFHLSSSKHERIPATKRALSKFARAVRGCRVVCEASGGYERPLMDALTSAGIDCAPVQRCRDAEMQRWYETPAQAERRNRKSTARHLVRGHLFAMRWGGIAWRNPHWRGDPNKKTLH